MKLPLKLDFFQICLTNMCNNRCVMCHQAEAKFQARQDFGYMSKDLFRKIFDDFAADNISFPVLHLFWKGEPFLNPDIVRMIEYACEVNKKAHIFENLYINTNGIPLTQECIRDLCDILNNAGISSTINFSADSVHQEEYQKIRIGGDFQRMMNNIRYFIQYREENTYQYPYFIFQMVIQDLNGNGIDDFAGYWQNELHQYGKTVDYEYTLTGKQKDIVLFRFLQQEDAQSRKLWADAVEKWCGVSVKNQQTEQVRSLGSKIPEKLEYPCFHYFKTPVVDHKGNVLLCCVDFYSDLAVGNLAHQTFKEIWTGDFLEEVRLRAVTQKYDRLPLFCQDCHLYRYYPVDFREELIDYMNERNLQEFIPALEALNKKVPVKFETSSEYYELGRIYMQRMLYEKASQYFEKSLALGGKEELLCLALSEAYEKSGDYESAYKMSERYIGLFPERPEGYYAALNIYECGYPEFDELMELFLQGAPLPVFRRFADILQKNNRTEQAISVYEQAVQKDNGLCPYFLNLLMTAKKYEQAAGIIRKSPHVLTEQTIPEAALAAAILQDEVIAETIWEKAQQYDEDCRWAAAMMFDSLKKYERAEKIVRVLADSPRFSEQGHMYLGFLAMNNQKYSEALNCFLGCNQRNIEVMRNLGYIYEKIEDFGQAAYWYEQIACQTGDCEWYVRSGILYKECAVYDKACEMIKKSGSDDSIAKETLQYCQNKLERG